jgi:Uma2 family endonuclease
MPCDPCKGGYFVATLITDPHIELPLQEQRRAWGTDHHDEVWEGVYVMAPMADNDHQDLLMELAVVLREAVAVPGLGTVLPGANLAGFGDAWEHDYRVPDIVVLLKQGAAEDCGTHWRGAADFVVEITSPGDRSREKLPFYSRLGVLEVLIIDRRPWKLELFRRIQGRLELVAQGTPDGKQTLDSNVVPLSFRLVAAEPRPKLEVTHRESTRRRLV